MGFIFNTLFNQRNKEFLLKSNEYKFYIENKSILSSNKYFEKYDEISNDFDVIKANIIIRALLNKNYFDLILTEEKNKNYIDQEYAKEVLKERLIELPYIKYNNLNIYIPFFNRQTNEIYSNEFEKMNDLPYSDISINYDEFIIDPFETYSFDLFDSTFSELVKIEEDNSSAAFFHYELNCIFIINKQGSLDCEIHLFDKHIDHPQFGEILERIIPLIHAYYSNNMMDFVYLLLKNNFISYLVFRKICKGKNL